VESNLQGTADQGRTPPISQAREESVPKPVTRTLNRDRAAETPIQPSPRRSKGGFASKPFFLAIVFLNTCDLLVC